MTPQRTRIQRPVQFGARFSMKARAPSCASSLANTTSGREEASLDLRKTEHRVIGCNDEITREKELESSGDGRRVRRPHDGLLDPFAQEAGIRRRSLSVARFVAPFGEVPQVHTCAE